MALSSPPPSNPMRDIGLLPVVHSTYLAPGGNYSCLAFTHRPECRNGAHDNEVRALISRLAHESFDLVEAASQGILLARGCSPECRFDRATTIGLYHRFHSSSGSGAESYAPPSSLPSSQLTPSGSEPPRLRPHGALELVALPAALLKFSPVAGAPSCCDSFATGCCNCSPISNTADQLWVYPRLPECVVLQ